MAWVGVAILIWPAAIISILIHPKNGSSSRPKTENSSIDAGLWSISMTAEQFLLGDSFKFHNVFLINDLCRVLGFNCRF